MGGGGVFIPEMGFLKIILKIKIQRGILPETPDPIKQTRAAGCWQFPECPGFSGEEREYWPTSGKAPKAGEHPRRLVYQRPGAGRLRCPSKGGSGRDPDAGQSGQRDRCLGYTRTSSAAQPSGQRRWDSAAQAGSRGRFLSFIPKLKLLQERPKGLEEGRRRRGRSPEHCAADGRLGRRARAAAAPWRPPAVRGASRGASARAAQPDCPRWS